MGVNTKQFNISLENFKGDTLEAVTKKKRLIGLKLLRGVVMKTPVDTGRARANWQLSINSPKTDEVTYNRKAPIPSKMSERNVSGSVVAEGNAQLRTVKLGEDIYITNNLPYIKVLEDGDKNRPPNRMVFRTVMEIRESER